MKNLTIILLVFYLVLLLGSLIITDPLLIFILIFFTFLITFFCLIGYLGFLRGLILFLGFIILPFIIEYLFFRWQVKFFPTALIEYISTKRLDINITLANLFTLILIPIYFSTSLFFAQKLRIYFNVKKVPNLFIGLASSFFIAINFLYLDEKSKLNYYGAIKWLIVALILNFIFYKLYKFRPTSSDLFKELPIILILSLFGLNTFHSQDNVRLTIMGILTLGYFILLYHEHRLKKVYKTLKPWT